MSDLLIERNHDREQECHGINSYHPYAIPRTDPFDDFTKWAAILAGLCLLGMLIAPFFRN